MSPHISDAHCNFLAKDDSGDPILLSNPGTLLEGSAW